MKSELLISAYAMILPSAGDLSGRPGLIIAKIFIMLFKGVYLNSRQVEYL